LGGGDQGAAQLIFKSIDFFASQPLPLETADTQSPPPLIFFLRYLFNDYAKESQTASGLEFVMLFMSR
jgi:hypothetical protein